MGLVNRLLPVEVPERLVEALLQGQRHLHSYGVTACRMRSSAPSTATRATRSLRI